jgi:signal transduction histidine kinase
LAAHRELYRETESTTDAESILKVALGIVLRYINADIAMYLPKTPGDSAWKQHAVLSQIDVSEKWLNRLIELIFNDEEHCPLIILPKNKADFPQCEELGLTGFISATVFSNSEISGRLVVCSRREDAKLSLADLSLLEVLCDPIGLRLHDLRTREHKERFLLRALHHITTPAHSVREIARQLTNESISAEERQRWLTDLTEQSERLVRLSLRARKFSDLQRGTRARHRLSIKNLIQIAANRFQALAATKQISLETKLPDADIELEADEDALQSALQSLLENAIKFSPERGQIQVVLTINEPQFTVSVLDQGPGVPQSQRDQIFEELISIPRGNVPESTGMGLTIAKLAIEEHGGNLQCLNNPDGEGACFSFTIPR